ncbi:CDP-glycerol:poly(glycerophosphate) glycerophosphotransferase [Actinomadura rubteroloni]|uniref:CDP-glycerol:poly(Glycerophosphate) glycerophosphotransferase n=1 Tax=Actinomadura rubteroloni TaxID=1926885 RepID=A0A2P4UM03_9ACTN|nr:bifunctional glycosyltransferase/CDP-glycerol:glycerophosphate glycerophosphotransferase [Actinomadura rubteroloni]POM26083.1 CDP-glycerol:poly(glycerophosphate) glycerophosphotransferase [Actinomadura rubteroloni]
MAPTLSVVVPIHNVEDYLEDCLASLAAQTLTDIEVVMVDDGSTDGSAVIAKAFAERDMRFRLFQQENQGMGPARNTGLRHVTGTFLAFADSDDVVPFYAYERMVGTLRRTGSDLVCGGVEQFDSRRSYPARFPLDALRTTRSRTHVTRDPALLRDRTVWNKVIRRTFWDEHGITFPSGAYEDIPVAVAAHVHSRSTDIISDVCYCYRKREESERSITQRRTEPGNLEDRLAAARRISRFLTAHAPNLRASYELSTLDDDLMLFVDEAEDGDDAYRERMCRLVGEHVRALDPRLLERLPSIKRLKYHLVAEERADDLVTVLEYERTGLPAAPTEPRGLLRRRWYAGHPFRDDADRAFPPRLYDVTDELRLEARVDDIVWVGDRLRVAGHAYVPFIDMTQDDAIDVWLERSGSTRRHPLRVSRVPSPQVTADTKQAAACYDGAGFVVEIDPADFVETSARKVEWRLHAAVRAGVGRDRVAVSGVVASCGPAAQWPRFRDLFGGTRVQLVPHGGAVTLRFRRPEAMITGQAPVRGGVEVGGWVARLRTADDAVIVTCRERGASTRIPVRYGPPDPDGRVPFRFRLTARDLGPRLTGLAGPSFASRLHHDLSLQVGETRLRLPVSDDFAGFAHDGVLLDRTRYGNVTATAETGLVLTGVHWEGDALVVSGVPADAEDAPDLLVLRHRRTGASHAVPLDDEDGALVARLRPDAMPGVVEAPLAAGVWELTAASGDGRRDLAVTRDCLTTLPHPRDGAGLRFTVRPSRRGAGVHLGVRIAWNDDEDGPYARRVLRERHYPAFLRREIRDVAVFESYFGGEYSCNPKAIYEEFQRRETGLDLVWTVGDGHVAVPGGRTVRRLGREYWELVARARYIVNNVYQPEGYRPRLGQVYLQTWHGTPIKNVGFETRWDVLGRRDQRTRLMAADAAAWGLLLSQNPHSTETLTRAFRYDGEVLETGYPRNDRAHGPDAASLRERVRARLGIPPGKRAVLFAPTWRDRTPGHRTGPYRLGLDFERAAAALGEDTVLLLRPHRLLDARLPAPTGFVRDVSAYPDVTELFLASDALVTDYSSLMCDFAGLRRPILLFAPDLEAYRDDVRGFAYDLEERPPGPLLRTSDELIEALEEFDDTAAASAPALDDFAATFCPHDDGHAAARVVDRLLAL